MKHPGTVVGEPAGQGTEGGGGAGGEENDHHPGHTKARPPLKKSKGGTRGTCESTIESEKREWHQGREVTKFQQMFGCQVALVMDSCCKGVGEKRKYVQQETI